MLSSVAPSALSHGDGALGAGAEDCITSARRFWRVELGSRPRRRPTRRRASTAPLFRADGGGLSVGWISVGRDLWGGERAAGGMSEDNDRCFSMLVLRAFLAGVFQHH
jgi:hypothetical protein